MKTIATILAAITVTALTLYALSPSSSSASTTMLKADKGYLFNVHECGSGNYPLQLVSWTNAEQVYSRASVHMSFAFSSKELEGQFESMTLTVKKMIPLFSQTYKSSVAFSKGINSSFVILFNIPMIPIHATVDAVATLKDASGTDLLTVCAQLTV